MDGTRTHRTVAVGTAPTLLADRNNNRRLVHLQNQSSDTPIYLGKSGDVTSTGANTGMLLAPGAMFTDAVSIDPWVAKTAGGNVTVHVVEVS